MIDLGTIRNTVTTTVRQLRDRAFGDDAPDIAAPRAEGSDNPRPLRVMTWNLKAGHGPHALGTVTSADRLRRIDLLADEILKSDADVIMLQEVEQGYLRNGQAWEFDRLVQRLQATDAQFGRDRLGTAVITRNGVRIRDMADGTNQSVDKPLGDSSAMAVALQLPNGREITAVNVHTAPLVAARIGPEYLKQIADGTLHGAGSPFPRDVILAGDFNAPGKEVQEALRPWDVQDAASSLGIGWDDGRRDTNYTPIDLVPDRDHVLLSPRVGEVTRAAVPKPVDAAGVELSDHRPVVVDVAVRASG